jgi:hypothetical protein
MSTTKRKKETRTNPETGLKEERYEGDTFWVATISATGGYHD